MYPSNSIDCEKSLENITANAYDSTCGTEISDYLNNQRISPNAQEYPSTKTFPAVPNGKSSICIFFYFGSEFQATNCFQNEKKRISPEISYQSIAYWITLALEMIHAQFPIVFNATMKYSIKVTVAHLHNVAVCWIALQFLE